MGYRKFIILSSPRSGTHMLRSALARHPRVICLAEMFNPHWNEHAPYNDDTPSRELLDAHVWTPPPPGIDAIGFTIHRRGAPLGNRADAFDMLAAESGLHVIHLYRESLLRRYLSFRIMKEDKRGPETMKQMSASELHREFEQWTEDYAHFKQHFAHNPSIEVSYESLCNKPHSTLATVQQFLGLERRRIMPATTPNAPRRLQDLVPDLEQLATHFVDTPWYGQFAEGLPRARARGSVEL